MFSIDSAFGAVVLLLILGSLWLALRLFRNVRPISQEELDRTRRLARLEEQKDALGEELRTAELDCRLGRISLDDFRTERARIEPELVRVLAELDTLMDDQDDDHDDDQDDDHVDDQDDDQDDEEVAERGVHKDVKESAT